MIHSKLDFIQKYRKKLGCPNDKSEVCWCKVCVDLEKMWDDIIDYIKRKME